eukprot:776897-Pyramimonas_sp.AAC.1
MLSPPRAMLSGGVVFVLAAFDIDGWGTSSTYTITRLPEHGKLYYNATGPKTFLNKNFTAAIREVQVRATRNSAYSGR